MMATIAIVVPVPLVSGTVEQGCAAMTVLKAGGLYFALVFGAVSQYLRKIVLTCCCGERHCPNWGAANTLLAGSRAAAPPINAQPFTAERRTQMRAEK